jgi:hypothetical protein
VSPVVPAISPQPTLVFAYATYPHFMYSYVVLECQDVITHFGSYNLPKWARAWFDDSSRRAYSSIIAHIHTTNRQQSQSHKNIVALCACVCGTDGAVVIRLQQRDMCAYQCEIWLGRK